MYKREGLESISLNKNGWLECPGVGLESISLNKNGWLECPGVGLEHLRGELESVFLNKNGRLEPHPVWAFKNINLCGVGSGGCPQRVWALALAL